MQASAPEGQQPDKMPVGNTNPAMTTPHRDHPIPDDTHSRPISMSTDPRLSTPVSSMPSSPSGHHLTQMHCSPSEGDETVIARLPSHPRPGRASQQRTSENEMEVRHGAQPSVALEGMSTATLLRGLELGMGNITMAYPTVTRYISREEKPRRKQRKKDIKTIRLYYEEPGEVDLGEYPPHYSPLQPPYPAGEGEGQEEDWWDRIGPDLVAELDNLYEEMEENFRNLSPSPERPPTPILMYPRDNNDSGVQGDLEEALPKTDDVMYHINFKEDWPEDEEIRGACMGIRVEEIPSSSGLDQANPTLPSY